MRGQWIGRYTGSNNGLALLDLDDEGDHYEGHAYAFDDNLNLPTVVGHISTNGKHESQSLEVTDLGFIRPQSTILISREVLTNEIADLVLPTKIHIELKLRSRRLSMSWTTDIGTFGQGKLAASKADTPSDIMLENDVASWNEFRDYALKLSPRRFIFRGQDVPKRLRTSFHRTRRKDLVRYLQSDVPQAHHALTARTRHLFNLQDNAQNGAFVNLLQHHGYPTPLLDWTYSPFVAAFFAYRRRQLVRRNNAKVRIFAFDRVAWERDWPQLHTLTFARPHFSILEALSIENPRAIPQQALSSVTNVDDIESHIQHLETLAGKRYLYAFDLPAGDRRSAMEELSVMGITAGSLFPGLDGACEELRGRLFHSLE